jgi:hypothetical protein
MMLSLCFVNILKRDSEFERRLEIYLKGQLNSLNKIVEYYNSIQFLCAINLRIKS